jgi:hypothetical protein
MAIGRLIYVLQTYRLDCGDLHLKSPGQNNLGGILMKAILCTKYGPPDVLQVGEVEKPIPKDNEVLINVHATTVNRTDCATLRAEPFIMRFSQVYSNQINRFLEPNLLAKLKLLAKT